jgi:hypothetical protein
MEGQDKHASITEHSAGKVSALRARFESIGPHVGSAGGVRTRISSPRAALAAETTFTPTATHPSPYHDPVPAPGVDSGTQASTSDRDRENVHLPHDLSLAGTLEAGRDTDVDKVGGAPFSESGGVCGERTGVSEDLANVVRSESEGVTAFTTEGLREEQQAQQAQQSPPLTTRKRGGESKDSPPLSMLQSREKDSTETLACFSCAVSSPALPRASARKLSNASSCATAGVGDQVLGLLALLVLQYKY